MFAYSWRRAGNDSGPAPVVDRMDTSLSSRPHQRRRRLGAAAGALVAALGAAPAAAQAPDSLPEPIGMEVRFASGSDTLDGTLLLPPGPGPHPAVVAIEGSGAHSFRRYWRPGVYPFWKAVAEHLVGRGYAVLLFDKPGVHRSTGDWRRQSFQDRAQEALAAVAFLAARPEIDTRRVGLIGHSQGGWIAQLAAAGSPGKVRFVITLAGPAVGVRRQVLDDAAREWECGGIGGVGMAVRTTGLRLFYGTLGLVARVARPGFLMRIVNYDPRAALGRITQPTLALFGTSDRLVYAETNAPRLRAEFGRASGNRRLFVRVVPSASHGFSLSPRCPRGDQPPRIAPGFFPALDDAAFWAAVGN